MSAQDLDTSRLQGYLAEHIAGFGDDLQAEKFAGGQSNPTFKLTSGGQQYVLRRKPPGVLLKSAHAVDREFRVMTALANTDVPVPKTYLLCEDDDIIGSMFFIMEYLDGRVFWDPTLPEVSSNEQRSAIYEETNRVLAALHSVDPQAVGLADYGKPGNYFGRQITRWTKQYRASETEQVPEMETLIDWLPANMPQDDGSVSLVHGDYRLDNIMFHPTEPRIIAVLDWELSTLGHPLADLSYQCMGWGLPGVGRIKGLADVDRAQLGIPSDEQYVASYCAKTSRDGIEDWEFYMVFCYFRLAAILQGVIKRAQDGNASNAKAGELKAMVGPLAGMGARLIR